MIPSLKGDRNMKYIYDIEQIKTYPEKINFEEKIGKKAQNLLELAVQGFNVPKFSVITNKYFREVILNEIKEYSRKRQLLCSKVFIDRGRQQQFFICRSV